MVTPTLRVPQFDAARFRESMRAFEAAFRQHPINHVEFTEAVNNGVAFLDERVGRDTWLPRINTATLDVRSSTCCPLAQSTGKRYADALVSFGIYHTQGFIPVRAACWTDTHGFSADLHDDDNWMRRYAALTAAWIAKVEELRAEGDSVRITAVTERKPVAFPSLKRVRELVSV